MEVDDLVSLHDLLNQVSGLLVVHGPDFLDSVVVRLFKSLVLLLEVLEPGCELLVLVGQLNVLLLEALGLDSELLGHLAEGDLGTALSVVEGLLHLLVDTLSFEEDLVVEFKLLLVKSVDSFHVLHALLENLHLGLQLDLGLVLLVGVGAHDFFELLGVILLVLLALVEVLLLKDTVLGEEVLDFLGVTEEDVVSLVVELTFDEGELGGVVLTHLLVLEFHVLDEILDVVSHGLHGLDVVLVLVIETLLEFINQDFLLLDDFRAGGFLGFNFLKSKK